MLLVVFSLGSSKIVVPVESFHLDNFVSLVSFHVRLCLMHSCALETQIKDLIR